MAAEAPAEPVPEGEITEVGEELKIVFQEYFCFASLLCILLTSGSGGGSTTTCLHGSHWIPPQNWHLWRFVTLTLQRQELAFLMIWCLIGMHMLPGENAEKLEGAPNFRQVGTYSTLYLHELELLGILLTFWFSGYWLPNFWSRSANRGRLLQSAGEDKSSVTSFKLRRPCSCSCSCWRGGPFFRRSTQGNLVQHAEGTDHLCQRQPLLAKVDFRPDLSFSSLPSQVSWWSAQEPWDPVLSGRTWNPSEALS